MSMKQTAIRIEDDLKKQALKRAKDKRRSFGSYVRDLIAADIEKAAKEAQEAGETFEKSGKSKIEKARGKK